MALYVLKYYKDIPQTDGSVIRLEILKKQLMNDVPSIPIAEVATDMEIGGVVQSLHLQIQGQQGDVDTPIVKTSLVMTFVDAPDIEDGRKNGNWDEFYTADATGWKVILKEKTLTSTEFKAIWGGYITPDSYSEDIVYHGSVTIVARDNIGHLQDFPFDAESADGTISLYDLVTKGWEKIESPMVLDWNGDGNAVNWLKCSGVILYDTRMNLSFFEGMTWYEAIEKAFYSYGLVMRYVGRNRVHICPLRDMPKHGYFSYSYFATKEPIFVTGATRELVPAAKMIQETVSYDLEDSVSFPQIEQDRYTGVETSYRCKIEGDTYGRVEHDAPIWAISELPYYTGWDNYTDYSLCFDISRYGTGYFTERQGGDAEMRKYMYIAANNVDARSIMFRKFITPCEFAIKIKFGRPLSINSANKLEQQSVYNLEKIIFRIEVKQGGDTYYYAGNGEWKVDEHTMTYEYDPQDGVTDFEVQVKPNVTMVENADSQTKMTLHIYKVVYRQMGSGSLQHIGLYACIQDFAIAASDTASLMKKNNVKTVYNEDNNIVIKRDPEIAPTFDAVPFPGLIKNGIFVENLGMLQPTPEWRYGDEKAVQLPVHIHKQLLCYHAKPNNLISGTIVNSGTMGLSCNWLWRGKEHILTSGSLNLITGHMEGAVLREFVRYEDMWKDEEMPSGYTPLEYVENAGSGYVNTGITIASLDASVSVDCQFISIPSSSAEMAWGYSKGQNFIPRWCFAAHSGKWYGSPNVTTTTGKADTNRHTFEMSVGTSASGGAVYRGKIDGLTLYSETALVYPSDFQLNNMPVYLFARNNNGTADLFGKCRIYGFKVVDGGKITNDLRPCRDADGAVGFYDMIARRFCKGVGSGLTGEGAGEVIPEGGGNTTPENPSIPIG